MGDFFTAPIGSPLPPPEPDIPAPDFSTIANGIAAGLDKSGISDSWLGKLVQAGVQWFTIALGLLITTLIKLFAYFIRILGDATTDAQGAYGDLVAATLKELFGVTVNPADVSTRVSGPGRQAAASKLAQSIIGPMFAGSQAIDGGGVTPSSNAADSFLAVTMNMELNGWLESWITDGISGHLLEKYGDLKDGISHTLGLGRLSRQVFAAPLKVLVHDPYLALLEQKYRTRPWDVTALMARLNRGQITRADLSTPMGNAGYTEAQIDELVREHQKNLPLADLDYLDQRGLATAEQIHDIIVEQGYPDGTASTILQIMRDKRVQRYRDQMVQVGEAAYVAGNIGPDTFATIIDQSGVTDEEKEWIGKIADLKVSVKNRHLTEGEIIKGIEDGLLNFNDLKTWAIREGVSPQDEAILELETQFTENKASALAKTKAATAKAKVDAANAKLAIAQAKAQTAQAQAADKGLTAATAGTLVKDGLWTIAQYRAFLQTHGYGPDATNDLVNLLNAQLNAAQVKTAAAGATRAGAPAKGLNLAQIEKAVVEGILTTDQLHSYLTKAGYSEDDAQVILDLTQGELTAAQVKKDATAAAHAKAATKSISIPDLDRAVRLGLTTVDTYTAALQKAGFDAASITLLTGILQSQVTADKATAAKSAAAGALATSKGITIAQLAAEVVAGVRPIADYGTALQAAGYGHEDQVDLTALLQLKVDQAASTAAKRTAASKALAAKGISLPAAERAAKLGVVPVSVYTGLLQSLNYTPDAVQVLTNSLIAEIGATKKAQAAANGAAATLATKQISLPDLEKAVIAGVRPIADYTGVLTTAGYSAGDVDTLTQLLQLKTDQHAAAVKAHADADGLATQKGIALGKEEAAVVAGDLTMADYDALLTSLGFDAVDRGVLEQLLQAKVDAKAAKG